MGDVLYSKINIIQGLVEQSVINPINKQEYTNGMSCFGAFNVDLHQLRAKKIIIKTVRCVFV